MRVDGKSARRTLVTLGVACLLWTQAWGQEAGVVRGSVTLIGNGDLVHGAVVLIVGTGLVTLTDDQGRFEVENVPTETYEVLAQREHLTAGRQTITVEAGQAHELSFELGLSPVHEEVTVTATAGGRITAFEAFNAITTLDSFELVTDPQNTLGDALENQPGVAKRSFGPGSSRPIIRGFDGDRVLMMEDGIRTGDLASQSGDQRCHDRSQRPGADRDCGRGPATLLYGSNAVGGVVNAITPHESYRDSMTEGARGQFSADGGSANDQAGTNASVQHARGNLMIWAGGGARRTSDYGTPLRTIANSATSLASGLAGVGYFGERVFASSGFTIEDGRYGVPFAGEPEERGPRRRRLLAPGRMLRYWPAESGQPRCGIVQGRLQRDRLATRRDRDQRGHRDHWHRLRQPNLRGPRRAGSAPDEQALREVWCLDARPRLHRDGRGGAHTAH